MRACLGVSVKSPLSTYTPSNKAIAQVSVLRVLSQTAHKKGTHIKIRFHIHNNTYPGGQKVPKTISIHRNTYPGGQNVQKQFLSTKMPILVDRKYKKQFLSTEIPILVDRTFKYNFYPRKCPFWWTECGQKNYVNIKGVM